jgi:hypothetical protein
VSSGDTWLGRRCSAFCSTCVNSDPFPSLTPRKYSKTSFLLGVKWASVGRGAAPCHWPWHKGPAIGELAGWTAPSEPAQAQRQGHRTRTKPPDINHSRYVQSCKRWEFFSVCLSGNPSSCGGPGHGSALEKCNAPTNMQPWFQAGSTSKNIA